MTAAAKTIKLYHGSTEKFDNFDYKKIGTHGRMEGVGFYFTDNINIAKGYAEANGFLYTIEFNGKKSLSDNNIAITEEQLKNILEQLHEKFNLLNDINDIDYYGYDYVLNEALENYLSYNDNDIELISNLCNDIGGAYEEVNKIIYNVTGCDHIKTVPDWGKQNIYVALIKDCFKITAVEKITE